MTLDDLNYAEYKLNLISEQELDSTLYLDYWLARFNLALYLRDQTKAKDIYNSHLAPDLKNAEAEKTLNKRRLFKSEKTAKTLSTILPGLGQMYAGKPGHAAISMLLTGGSILYSAVSFTTGYYATAVLTGIPLTVKFYLGGRDNANNIVMRKNNAKRIWLVGNLK
jgi:TM2 domain-containing membrane protein YozV